MDKQIYDIILPMDPLQSPDQNNLIKDTVLSSKYFNPEYLLNKGHEFLNYIFSFGTGSQLLTIFNIILFILSTFFLVLIAYCTVRMFELRKKERAHLEHEIAEYARKHKND